ncbi:MAG: SPOR domain-containing protein, partial [Flavobacteriales bacterium]
PGAPVDARGVTIDDDGMLNAWLNWKDSANSTIISSRVESFGPIGKPKITYANMPAKRSYVVKVGAQTAGISEEMIQRILSLPDVRTIERGDTTYYIVGNYNGSPDALQRELMLKGQGFDGQVMVEQDGKLVDLPQDASTTAEQGNAAAAGPDNIVIRVQLGAFRHIAQVRFRGIDDVVSVKGGDGLTRYYVGSFTDVNAAARRKVDMVLKGFDGAFLVAFKDGKRVSMQDAGAQLTGPEDLQDIHSDSVNTDNLTFRVQVGTYAGNVPMDKMGKYGNMGKVKPVTSQSAVRYLYGEYPTRAAAELARQELQNLGFQDAFVVGELNGRIIQAEDAEKLQKGQ